jgi:hypothetical protein
MADLIDETERLQAVFIKGEERARALAESIRNGGKQLPAKTLQERSVDQSQLTVDLCRAAQGLIEVLWALEHWVRLHRNDAGEHWPTGGPPGDPLST